MKRLFKSKSFLGSIIFAAALWGYTSLNHRYTPFITVPLTIKPPADKAIENEMPHNIALKVEGSGWQLFYLIFFNSTKQCFIDLSDRNFSEDEFIITRTDILKSIQNIIDVEPKDVLPETMKLQIGRIATYKVPVNPIILVTPKDGFIAMSEITLMPDSIEITGNDKVVRNIKYWNTEKVNIENLYKNSTIPIPLSDSLNSIVKLSNKSVNVSINLEQSVELTIYDIPIKIRGGILPKNHKIIPETMSITVHGGVEQIANLTGRDISSYIDYKDIIIDTTGIIKPKVEFSEKIIKYHASPNFVYHFHKMSKLEP